MQLSCKTKTGRIGEKMRSAAMHYTTRQASVQGILGRHYQFSDYQDLEQLLGEFLMAAVTSVGCHFLRGWCLLAEFTVRISADDLVTFIRLVRILQMGLDARVLSIIRLIAYVGYLAAAKISQFCLFL
jgi:hypothetical protein